LNRPNWLVLLYRNSEWPNDVDHFLSGFEDELKYLSKLWEVFPSYSEFMKNYSRNISNKNG